MKKPWLILVLLILAFSCSAQENEILYKKQTFMIPMRDGVKLFTLVLYPINLGKKAPILITRTPYGSNHNYVMTADSSISLKKDGTNFLAKDGYIFVYQDIRGKYKSEGKMQIHQPLTHRSEKGSIDESTDTYDTVDWLIHNVPNNNGRAGIYGISYPGWLALLGAVDPHPALKVASEQACMGDLFLGDDFHHNGAFRLSYGMEYSYEIENDHTTDSQFPFPQFDLYNWYLNLGPISNVQKLYFHNKIPTWNTFIAHPDYDSYWQKNSTLNYIPEIQIPMLHVGGYFDQEDLNGPQLMYAAMEKGDTKGYNHIVLGPWNHGGWSKKNADSLGLISFESNTAEWFQILQKKWFDFYLKDIGSNDFKKAYAFQTGSNKWKAYSSWPPKEPELTKLFIRPEGKLSFNKPLTKGTYSYTSDPNKPVPYRALPIEATYGKGSRWYYWQVEDQRFVSTRPDVAVFIDDSLKADLTVTGQITAHLRASTTGSDADWIVKLIDVYPDFDPINYKMSYYQFPVAMEVFRGKYRKSFSKPQPLIPGKPEDFVINLHQINHTFKKGHRIMVQIQSTWFPVIDRNPQKFVANIFEAKKADFIKATQTIYYGGSDGTYLEMPIVK